MEARAQATRILESIKSSGVHYRDSLPMIASENIVSPMVQKIVSSDLPGRYAEGLPYKRYYQGCGDFDTIDLLEMDEEDTDGLDSMSGIPVSSISFVCVVLSFREEAPMFI